LAIGTTPFYIIFAGKDFGGVPMVAFKDIQAHAGEHFVAQRVEAYKIFAGEKAGNVIGIQFGFGQVGFDARVVSAKNNYFLLRILHVA
jgi:hypothetical protein